MLLVLISNTFFVFIHVNKSCGYSLEAFFLFLYVNRCCGHSLEAPHRCASNEFPQHMFLWRNKKTIRIPPISVAMFYVKESCILLLPMQPAYCALILFSCRKNSLVEELECTMFMICDIFSMYCVYKNALKHIA